MSTEYIIGVDVPHDLSRIFSAQQFCSAPKLQHLLRYIVERSVDDPAGLNGRAIAVDVFKEGRDFNTSSDSRVRVAVNRLRSALKLYYAESGRFDPVIIEIPRGSYVARFNDSSKLQPKHNQSKAASGGNLERDHILKEYWNHQHNASSSTNASLLRATRSYLMRVPDDVEMLAIQAEAELESGVLIGRIELDQAVDLACETVERAIAIEPGNTQVSLTCAFLALNLGDNAKVLEHAVALEKDNNALLSAVGLWFRGVSSSKALDDRSLARLSAMSDNLSWLSHVPFLSAYRDGNYDLALSHAIRFQSPNQIWGPLSRAVVLGQLGLRNSAEIELQTVIALNPRFGDQPRQHLGCFLPCQDDVEHYMDGLARAGFRT